MESEVYAKVGEQLEKTMENSIRDGVAITRQHAGSQRAGQIDVASGGNARLYLVIIIPN